MKKVIIVTIVLFGLGNIFALCYLVQKQKKALASLEESIQKEIDQRWQIAQDVRRQVETKKQARDFIVRLEFEKQIEDYNRKLEGYKDLLEESRRNNDESLNLLQADYVQLNELIRQMESGLNKKFNAIQSELLALSNKNETAQKELRLSNKYIKGSLVKMESSLKRRLETVQKEIFRLSEEFKEMQATQKNIPIPE